VEVLYEPTFFLGLCNLMIESDCYLSCSATHVSSLMRFQERKASIGAWAAGSLQPSSNNSSIDPSSDGEKNWRSSSQ